ncbi:AlpA family transcriptional regulator [Sphingomonas sp. 4RDLI-65]|uniref:helix-turn-helix transcriptional regulator n=1 Tax=Sphingomonas sp. 4RDLI-65 TaxID=3111641 RepID=UPI003C23D274
MTDAMAAGAPPTDTETPEQFLRSIVDLSRRWTSAGVKGKGIRLEGHEIDLLNAVGLGDILMSAAAVEQKKRAIERRSLRAHAEPAPPVEARALNPATADAEKISRSAGDRRGDNLLRIPEVRRRTGLSRATIYRRVEEKTFPPKVRLGPMCVAWYESDIDTFVADPSGYGNRGEHGDQA